MTTLQDVLAHISSVTAEQIGKAHKCFEGSKAFYMVESEDEKFDADGNRVEYKVSWSREHGFTCSCPAGEEAFVHCHFGFCKHVLWAVACAQEEKTAMAEQAILANMPVLAASAPARDHLLIANGQEVDQATYERIMNATPAKGWQTAKFPTRKPFSLLR